MNVSFSIFQWKGGNVPFYHFYNMYAITYVAIQMDEVKICLTKELNNRYFAFVFQQCVLSSNSSLSHHEIYLTFPSSYYHAFKIWIYQRTDHAFIRMYRIYRTLILLEFQCHSTLILNNILSHQKCSDRTYMGPNRTSGANFTIFSRCPLKRYNK